MNSVLIGAGSLVLMLLLIWAGVEIAIVLAGVSFLAMWVIHGTPIIGVNVLAQGAYDAVSSHIFGVVPLFVLTGFLVAHADVGKDAYEVANQLLRKVKGGLGHATVAANAVFAAITGISIASAAVFTKVAVPEMLRHGYNPSFSVGVVAGSSVLGMLIPPSLLMILYGFLTDTSVGDLFTAGIIPGILLSLLYGLGILWAAKYRPSWVYANRELPQIQSSQLIGFGEILRKIFPILILISSILGGLYAGFFTATEAGATGALVAIIIAGVRKKLDGKMISKVLLETGEVTVTISFLIICATIYTRMLATSGMPQALLETLIAQGVTAPVFLFGYVIIIILLGTVLDSASILLVMIPLALPVVTGYHMDRVWLGVVTVFAVEIGLLTPPFGLSVFVVKSSLGRDSPIGITQIFKGAAPFAGIMLLTLILLIIYPEISLALVRGH